MTVSNRAYSNSYTDKCVVFPEGANCVYCTYKFVSCAFFLGSPAGNHQLDT